VGQEGQEEMRRIVDSILFLSALALLPFLIAIVLWLMLVEKCSGIFSKTIPERTVLSDKTMQS
jgi:hypothetical protein